MTKGKKSCISGCRCAKVRAARLTATAGFVLTLERSDAPRQSRRLIKIPNAVLCQMNSPEAAVCPEGPIWKPKP